MKTSILILIFGAIVLIKPIYSQDNDSFLKTTNNKNYLGLNTGAITGFGFSYRYWPEKNGFQVTFLPLYDDKNTFISLGTTYLREIKKYKYTRFLFFASSHITNIYKYDVYSENLGFGIGFDFFFYDFVFNFMMGYAGYDITDDFKTRPSVEFGAFYNF